MDRTGSIKLSGLGWLKDFKPEHSPETMAKVREFKNAVKDSVNKYADYAAGLKDYNNTMQERPGLNQMVKGQFEKGVEIKPYAGAYERLMKTAEKQDAAEMPGMQQGMQSAMAL